MQEIAPGIFRVPPVREPLSSDVFVVEGEKRFYVLDAGTSDAAYEAIRSLTKPVWMILSHFHRDHIGNMERLSPERVLCGLRTRKYVKDCTPVEEEILMDDGVLIRVQPVVSPHAPGCVMMTVNDTYTFLGDAAYARPGEGQGEAKGLVNALKKLNTQYLIASHNPENPVEEKEAALRDIRQYFGI